MSHVHEIARQFGTSKRLHRRPTVTIIAFEQSRQMLSKTDQYNRQLVYQNRTRASEDEVFTKSPQVIVIIYTVV